MNDSVAFRAFTVSYNQPLCLLPSMLITGNPAPAKQSFWSLLPATRPPSGNFLSLDLPVLDVALNGISTLGFFHSHHVLEVPPHCKRCLGVISLYDRIIFHCMERTHSFYPHSPALNTHRAVFSLSTALWDGTITTPIARPGNRGPRVLSNSPDLNQ